MATVKEIIASRLIKKIEEAIENGGKLPWQKPWINNNFPRSYETGRAYSGVNLLLLDPGIYITEKKVKYLQRTKQCGLIKKGAKSEILYKFFLKEEEIKDESGDIKVKTRLCSAYERVFNINDVHDLEPKFPIEEPCFEHEPIEFAENIVSEYLIRENIQLLHIEGDRAYYSPSKDLIVLPKIEQFKELSEYYSAKFHEIVHSTGLTTRLDRTVGNNRFGDEEYSKEELVAEIGSYLLCGYCNITTDDSEKNSVAYLRGWLKVIKEDISIILNATSAAQKAVDFILNVSDDKEVIEVL